MDLLEMIISLFGGLGLFLFGMKMMGDGLENASGERLKTIFEKITSNPIKGVLTGTAVTAVIQSSSATTVMVVGFVNARLMNLYQAASVILGANIGTTITAQIVALDLDKIIPVFIGIGALIVLFSKGKMNREIGNIVLGFGILFLGMGLMKGAMEPLSTSEAFKGLMIKYQSNMFLGLMTGLILTAIIQSSSASTGILIALSSTGAISLDAVIPMILGCNIGTCVTALISSIGTSKTAKKAAFMHLIIKIFGTIIFIPLMLTGTYAEIIRWIGMHFHDNTIQRQIANAHTLFNLTIAFVLLPFLKYIVKIVDKLLPSDEEEDAYGTKYIDERLLETPVIAVGQTVKEVVRMANISKDNLKYSMKAFIDGDIKAIGKVYENEKLINLLEDDITEFLVKLSKTELSEKQTDIVTSMFHVVNDIERIGDHAENIADLANEKIQKKLKFSEGAKNELNNMFECTLKALNISINCFENDNIDEAYEVKNIENSIDKLEKKLRTSHIKRLNQGVCNATLGAIFLDTISNLERIGDHSMNIAESVFNKAESIS